MVTGDAGVKSIFFFFFVEGNCHFSLEFYSIWNVHVLFVLRSYLFMDLRPKPYNRLPNYKYVFGIVFESDFVTTKLKRGWES